jgi:cytochrome c oxidase subunit II
MQELCEAYPVVLTGLPDSTFFGSVLRVLEPGSPGARSIYNLGVISAIILAGIFVIVTGMMVYALMRFRWQEGAPDPRQVAGHRKIEITWTAIPCVIVVLLFALTARAMRQADPPPAPAPDIIVVGHQWWWEMRYPKSGVVVANEIHIPTGQPLSLEVDSVDVLHEFWVPELGRKITAVPGHPNHIWLEADQPGTYLGVCTEFCGTEHAWMHFLVVVEPRADFEAWTAAQLRPATAPASANDAAVKGAALFQQLTCANCHAIKGTAAGARVGPDLTHFAGRRQLGAGIADNTPENLHRWLSNPQKVKPGVMMPDFKFADEQVTQLAAYLETLK